MVDLARGVGPKGVVEVRSKGDKERMMSAFTLWAEVAASYLEDQVRVRVRARVSVRVRVRVSGQLTLTLAR